MNIDWVGVGTLVTALAGVYLGWTARKTARERNIDTQKVTAEAGQAAAESVELLLKPLNDRIVSLQMQRDLDQFAYQKRTDALEAEIVKLKGVIATRDIERAERQAEWDKERALLQSQLSELRGGIMVLVSQLEQANIVPRWRPKTGPLIEQK